MAGIPRTPVPGGSGARRSAVVSCWMCGIRLSRDQMMPDGATACDDVRWYCEDTEACTERWTSASRHAPPARAVPPQGARLAQPPGRRTQPLRAPLAQARNNGSR